MSNTSLTDVAYAAVKERILANELTPGTSVSAEALCRELELSRTPVREALLRLAQEGFLEIRPRMGTFVAPLDIRRIHEMYQVRRALEGMAARQAANFADSAELEALETELLSLSRGADADLRALSEAGQKLHRLIVDSCENRVLAEMITSLQDHFRRFRSVSLQLRNKVLSSHAEHVAIVKALRSGDGDEAERLVQAHFEHAGQFLLESLIAPRRRS